MGDGEILWDVCGLWRSWLHYDFLWLHTVSIGFINEIKSIFIFIHCLSFSVILKFWTCVVLMLFWKHAIFCHCFTDASKHGRGSTRKWMKVEWKHHKISWKQWRRNIKNDEQISASYDISLSCRKMCNFILSFMFKTHFLILWFWSSRCVSPLWTSKVVSPKVCVSCCCVLLLRSLYRPEVLLCAALFLPILSLPSVLMWEMGNDTDDKILIVCMWCYVCMYVCMYVSMYVCMYSFSWLF